MAQKPVGKLTDEEKIKRREYQAQKKRESRMRMLESGLCVMRDAGCQGKAKPGSTICQSCQDASAERAKSKAQERGAWPIIPSKRIPRTIRKLRREGLTVNDILKDPYLQQYEVKKEEVIEIIREAGLD